MHRIYPAARHDAAADDLGASPFDAADVEAVAAAYAWPERDWLRVNVVASADGAAWLKGVSEGLSGEADRRVFAVLRGMADVVLAGAQTARTEGYGPVKPRDRWRPLREGRPPAPPIAVITRRIDLDLNSALFTEAEPYARPIVITCEAAPEDRRVAAAKLADVIVAGDDRVDMARAVAALRERGLRRILCEGGPRINGQLAIVGQIDELCLTMSPLMVGGGAARVLNGPSGETPLRLVQILEEDGFLFMRYLRERS